MISVSKSTLSLNNLKILRPGEPQDGNSQNFLKIILKIFVTLGNKILINLRLQAVFETEISQKIKKYLFSMNLRICLKKFCEFQP